ncbi:MAG TPA: hypothetical protein VKK79_19080, partial [Candidatus Lokiarchaeia archaeon]|nr:hypothetical protein [Candidatus Lokiarchaeia archaeon]
VAIVGHSFGAYTAVKTAYLDPRFKATVAMAAIFNQENIAIVKATPGSRAAGLDLANENLLPYLNATAPQNLLTIVGTDDTMAPPSDSAHIIGAAAGVAYDQVENGTMYGSISAGTAREELVFPDMNHATEAFDSRGQTAAVQWVEAALSLDTADLPPAPRGVGMVTFDAAVIATAVGVFLLLPLFSYAAQLIYREPRDDWYDRAKETDSKIGWQGIIAWTGAYFAVTGPLVWALVGLDGGYTIFPTFSVLDRVIVPFLVAGSGIVLCLIIILRRKTAFGQRWVRRPALLSEHPGKAILTGLLPMAAALVLAGLPMSLVILNLAPVGPRLVPFVVVTLLCMGGMVGASFVFRGIIGNNILRRRGFWSGRLLGSAISGFAVAGALSLCFIGTFGDFLLGLPPVEAFFGYWVVLGLGLTFVDFVCAQWVHGLTGDPTSAIVAQGILLGFFLSMIFPLL